MGRKRKKRKSQRKPRHFLQCPIIGCGKRVNKLVADPRYSVQYSRLCCEKCARRFKREQRRMNKNGQKEKAESQGQGDIFDL